MTRAQRKTHLIAWLVLGPIVLGVLIAAISLRIATTQRLHNIQGSPP